VQHYKMPCTGEGARLCYLIDRGSGGFEYLYDEIEGFHYRWGFSYEIVVARSARPAMADASMLHYRLVSAVERRVPADATFSLPVNIDGEMLIQVRAGVCTLLGAVEIDADERSCDALRRRDTVTFRHHATEQRLVIADAAP
jgi:hypothetical protein